MLLVPLARIWIHLQLAPLVQATALSATQPPVINAQIPTLFQIIHVFPPVQLDTSQTKQLASASLAQEDAAPAPQLKTAQIATLDTSKTTMEAAQPSVQLINISMLLARIAWLRAPSATMPVSARPAFRDTNYTTTMPATKPVQPANSPPLTT